MSYTVLARKYRPQRFSEVIGQDHVTRTLKNAIEQKRIAHGYIFSGHRGIGKTTIARILAMALNCRGAADPVAEPCGVCESCTEIRAGNAVDVLEIDAATNRGIDEIRELREAARYRPARDRFKILILDEAHQITDAAFNALLKTLEEPPSHIIFMMCTTQPEDIPQTIRSRCQHFSFHAVRFDDIVGQLKEIASQEGIQADEDAVAVLAEAGDGSMRDALSILDQAIAGTGEGRLTAEQVRGLVGSVSTEILEGLLDTVARNSSQEALSIVDKLVTEGQSPAHFARQLVRFLRNVVVAKISGAESPLLQISRDERARVARSAAQFSEEDLARFLQIALRTHEELGYKQEQRFHLELGILKMVHAQRLLPIEELLSQQPGHVNPQPRTAAPLPRPASPPAARSAAGEPSLFESDRVRKGRSAPEMSSSGGANAQVSADPVVVAKAVATATVLAVVESKLAGSVSNGPVDLLSLRGQVLDALERRRSSARRSVP
ncbi:MAG: DNA polymerase III subunit gamma/tau [Acidobacteriales bacterium]|nr:DNA polymerase III subunit gamma/tau [Terriglobales bacterium]